MFFRAGVGATEALSGQGCCSLLTGPALMAIYTIIICCNWFSINIVMRALPIVSAVMQPQRSVIPPMLRVAWLKICIFRIMPI